MNRLRYSRFSRRHDDCDMLYRFIPNLIMPVFAAAVKLGSAKQNPPGKSPLVAVKVGIIAPAATDTPSRPE